MKRIIIFSTLVLFALLLALTIPLMIQNAIVSIEIVSPSRLYYSEDIFTNGYIEPQSKKDVVAELPIVPNQIFYEVGDAVQIGDIIATIDTVATQSAIFDTVQAVNAIPQEYQDYLDVASHLPINESMIENYLPTEIISPAEGIITSIELTEGAMCMPQTTIVTITKADKLKVRMTVNENDADKLTEGSTVVFKANATGDRKYTGFIEKIFPNATKTLVGTTQATVVSMYVTPSEQYNRLKAGYTVSGVVKQPSKAAIWTLPYEAILQDENNKEYVYLVQGLKLQKCYITTGKEFSEHVEVLTPDLTSQKVVADATQIKKENCFVRIITNE